jgi:glycosyltransferase involved in cell wall biosynthesis
MLSYAGEFELILVNDASPDGITWPAIEQSVRSYPWVRGYDLVYNVGQFRAILCGMEHARGSYVITMDDDLQHPPEELPTLIKAMNEAPEFDCIIGAYRSKRHSFVRNLGSKLFGWLNRKIYAFPPDIKTTSFRIMKREIAQALVAIEMGRPIIAPMIFQVTRKVKNVVVEHHERKGGKSGYDLRKCVWTTIQNIINGSLLPLRFFAVVGFLASGLAFLIGIYYFLRKLTIGIPIGGYASLIVTLSFFSGLILAAIGVLGEYIARIIEEVSGPPRYIIRRAVGDKDDVWKESGHELR